MEQAKRFALLMLVLVFATVVYVVEGLLFYLMMMLFDVPFLGRLFVLFAFFKIAIVFGLIQWLFWHPSSFWKIMVQNADPEEIRQLVFRGIPALLLLSLAMWEVSYGAKLVMGFLVWQRQYQLMDLASNVLLATVIVQLGIGMFALVQDPDAVLYAIRVLGRKYLYKE